MEHDEPGRRQNARRIQDQAEGHSDPLPNRRPAFLTGVSRNLGPCRRLFQLGNRNLSRLPHFPFNRQPPVLEFPALQRAETPLSGNLAVPGSTDPVAGNDVMSFSVYSLTSDSPGSSVR